MCYWSRKCSLWPRLNRRAVLQLLLEATTAYTGVFASLGLFKANKAQPWNTRFVWKGSALVRAFGIYCELSERSGSFGALRRLPPVTAECVHAGWLKSCICVCEWRQRLVLKNCEEEARPRKIVSKENESKCCYKRKSAVSL